MAILICIIIIIMIINFAIIILEVLSVSTTMQNLELLASKIANLQGLKMFLKMENIVKRLRPFSFSPPPFRTLGPALTYCHYVLLLWIVHDQ